MRANAIDLDLPDYFAVDRNRNEVEANSIDLDLSNYLLLFKETYVP